jgi:hypothetical protein
MGISKIKSTQNSGDYQSKFDGSTMYTSEVELEDGSVGVVSAKTIDRWSVGDEVEYTLTATNHGNKLKLTRPNADFSGANATSTSNSVDRYHDKDAKRQSLIMNQWAIRLAMEWEMNLAPPDKVNVRQAILLAQKLKAHALDLENADTSVPEVVLEEKPF